MRANAVILLLVVLSTGSACMHAYQAETGDVAILRSSRDGDALEGAAIALIRSGTAGNLDVLSKLLRDPGFLNRLDSSPDLQAFHLGNVLADLVEHPTPLGAELCLTLAEDPAYTVDDRRIFLLKTLATLKPMSERAQRYFETANEQGYFTFNARLLTANGSPRALALFETMMLDKEQAVPTRLECLHVAVLPHRLELPVLRAADRIVARASEPAIALGAIESVFDFRQSWFGIESGISGPPAWQDAPADSLRFAGAFADKVLQRRDLRASLRVQLQRQRAAIEGLLSKGVTE